MRLNHKRLWVLLVLLVLLGLTFALYQFSSKQSNTNTQTVTTQAPPVELETAYVCPAVGTNVVQIAVENLETQACDCLEDETSKADCRANVSELILFNNAISQFDANLCENIPTPETREACANILKSAESQLRTQDPFGIANVKANNNNLDAITDYEALLEKKPQDVDTLVSLGLLYAQKGLEEQESGRSQTPYVEKSLATIAKAKELSPLSSEVVRAEAFAYEIKPDIATALNLYDRAIELDQNNLLAYIGRGHAHELMGAIYKALDDYETALTIEEQESPSVLHAYLCRLKSSDGQLINQALEHCSIAAAAEDLSIKRRSDSIQIEGLIRMRQGDFKGAESMLYKASILTPQDSNLYTTLAELSITQEDFEGAEVHARKAIEIAQGKAVPRYHLAYSLFQQGKVGEAIVAAQEGIGLIDSDVSLLQTHKDAYRRDLYYTLANIYFHEGNKQKEKEYKEKGDTALPQ